MITQKNNVRQYKLLKQEYDHVINDVMINGYDSNGPYSDKVAEKIKEITKRKHVFTTISGTSAITIALYGLDLLGKSVAVSSFNYSACASQPQVFSKPVYVDCDENGLIDGEKIPTNCDAALLTNLWGNVVDYDAIGKKLEGKIITDCSHSLGAKYKGKNDGYFGHVSTFAFGGNKPIGTRGFAGAIATDDDDLAKRISCVLHQGRVDEDKNLPVTMLGVRGASQELQMALVHVGMKYLNEWNEKKRGIKEYITQGVEDLPLRVIKPNVHCESSNYKLAFEVDNRDKFINHMQSKGVDAQVTYIDNFNNTWGDGRPMPMTDRLTANLISVPLSPLFSDTEVDTILSAVKSYYGKG